MISRVIRDWQHWSWMLSTLRHPVLICGGRILVSFLSAVDEFLCVHCIFYPVLVYVTLLGYQLCGHNLPVIVLILIVWLFALFAFLTHILAYTIALPFWSFVWPAIGAVLLLCLFQSPGGILSTSSSFFRITRFSGVHASWFLLLSVASAAFCSSLAIASTLLLSLPEVLVNGLVCEGSGEMLSESSLNQSSRLSAFLPFPKTSRFNKLAFDNLCTRFIMPNGIESSVRGSQLILLLIYRFRK